MSDPLQLILKKLDDIDTRIKQLEGNPVTADNKPVSVVEETIKNIRDPLFSKAVDIAQKNDEVPSSLLQKLLNVDQGRAEKLIDQMVEAGVGTSFWGDV